jgi:BirA family biotin operon repressor/biotin-[acetyl-CoA-carboxylase] ligase
MLSLESETRPSCQRGTTCDQAGTSRAAAGHPGDAKVTPAADNNCEMTSGFARRSGQRLDAAAVRTALAGPPGFWAGIDVVAETGSTNEDLLEAARRGAPEGTVLVAESQTAGRGRQGRSWETRPGAGLTCSMLLRPVSVAPARRGWVPLLTGVAAAAAVGEVAGVDARLKWPNDLLAGGGKLAGILAEQAGDAIVVGVGLNVTARADELPPTGATSLALLGASRTDREPLLISLLRNLAAWYLRWTGCGGDPVASGLREAYLGRSATVGREVRVSLPGGRLLAGAAAGVDETGRLLVTSPGPAGPGAVEAVSAGDVIHVR